MRVTHITPEEFRPGRMGGGERYVQQLVDAQARKGVDTVVISLPTFRSGPRHQDRPMSWRRFRHEIGSSDVAHVHQFNMQTFDATCVAASMTGTPLVLTDHGGLRRTPGRLLGDWRLRHVDAVAAVSPYSLDRIDAAARVQNRSVLWGGGDHLAEDPSLPDLVSSDFLFVGRILPHKGLHVLIEALPAGASLRIAGETRDVQYKDFLTTLAAGKDVEFVGAPRDAELHSLYRSSRWTVLPSVDRFGSKTYPDPELLGLVMLESLAAGTPVIGSRIGGLGELLAANGMPAFAPGSTSELSDVLTWALQNRGPEFDRADFSWATVADRSLNVYASVLGGD